MDKLTCAQLFLRENLSMTKPKRPLNFFPNKNFCYEEIMHSSIKMEVVLAIALLPRTGRATALGSLTTSWRSLEAGFLDS